MSKFHLCILLSYIVDIVVAVAVFNAIDSLALAILGAMCAFGISTQITGLIAAFICMDELQ